MTTLHLGVVDIPYVEGEKAPVARKRVKASRHAPKPKAQAGGGVKTTGDVAEILEDKYGIMQAFFNHHQDEIVGLMEKSVEGALEDLFAGRDVSDALHRGVSAAIAEAESEIENKFKNFLATREVETLGIPGVPTEAAKKGVSHRFKHPYKKRPARPSFIDTGLFSASFATSVD